MTIALTIAGTSAVVLIALLSLFKREEVSNRRVVLSGVRESFDVYVIWVSNKVSYIFKYLGSGLFRIVFHYILHTTLGLIIKFLTKMQGYLSHLQLRNKRIAKVSSDNKTSSHLDAIAVHKEEVSLSEEEKRKRRLH